MRRDTYKLFSPAMLGPLPLKNRLVRSATWDPSIVSNHKMTTEVLDLYERLARGGVGLIITGGLPVLTVETLQEPGAASCDALEISGIEDLVEIVHSAGQGCKVIAQLETDYLGAGPSEIPTPFGDDKIRPLSTAEIQTVIRCFVAGILKVKDYGFDGVQLHGAHGGLLSCFLSSYTNRREDAYGGSAKGRARIVREIVTQVRETVGNFPILIKMNATDYVEGGVDLETFPALAKAVEDAGVDAIEISGGMWDCLNRSEEELGFRPVPSPESHTRIQPPEKQSYFLKYAEALNLRIPVILVGGNRDVERLEAILQQGRVNLIALCRPLISEPSLPNRWREGRGSSGTDCISCNSCIHAMYMHPGSDEPGLVTCIFKEDKSQHKMAQAWLAAWVEENIAR